MSHLKINIEKSNVQSINPKSLGTDCLGVVLAGGLSSRMGQDKAKLVRNNKDMLSFSQQLLQDAGATQVVVSGDQYQVPDLFEQAGPVGGIYSVLQKYQPQALLIMPVDLPLMTVNVLEKLRITGELSKKACFYQSHSIPLYLPNNAYLSLFFQHFFQSAHQSANMNISDAKGRCAKTSRPQINNAQKKKGPSFKALLAKVPHQTLALTQPTPLFNSNTPEQWQQAESAFMSCASD